MTRLAAALTRTDIRIPGASLPLMSVSQTRGVVRRSELTDKPPRAESLDVYKVVRQGEIAFNKMSIRAGALGVAPEDGLVTYHYEVMRTRPGHDASFLVHLMKSDWFIRELIQRERGIGAGDQTNVRTTEVPFRVLKAIDVRLPSLPEQRAIADFLDRETAKIDALIEKQHAMVELLRERRAVAIRRVLTRGVQMNASTRASDIPLIDSLPSHWETVPLRHLCRITTGSEDSGNADPGGRYPFYVRGQEILRIDSHGFDGEAVLTPGDGQGGTGKVFHYAQGKFQAHQRVYVFIGFRGVLGRYVYYWLSTFLKAIALAGSNTVTMESLRRPLLASIPVALPPPSEQQAIVERLDREAKTIDALIEKAEEFIVLARERRAALITAAVTGHIDVVGEAI